MHLHPGGHEQATNYHGVNWSALLSVVYKGVSKLCFSCGHLGHRREAYQYTIKPSSSVPKESPVLNGANKVAYAPPSTKAQTEPRDILEVESTDAAFGVWMVVSRKRKDAKVLKKSQNTPFSILSYAHPHVSPKESLESNILEKELSGPSIIKGSEGKRKAHAELDSSSSIEDKELNTSLNGSAHSG